MTNQPRVTPPGMRNIRIPLTKIAPHPRNYRRHPEAQIRRLASSLIRFGQVRSIVVQAGDGEAWLTVAGHGIVEAAKLILSGEIPDVPERRLAELREGLRADEVPATWSPDQVEGYLVADNLQSAASDDDQEQLLSILQEQADAGFQLESLGVTQEELDEWLQDLADQTLEIGDLPGADERPPANLHADDPNVNYENKYAVAVLCVDEPEQQEIFARLKGMGYTCKVLVV